MVSRTLTVNNPEGLHMRPAGVVAKEMGKFACDVKSYLEIRESTQRVLLILFQLALRKVQK